MQTNFTGKSHLDWYFQGKTSQKPSTAEKNKETNPIYAKLDLDKFKKTNQNHTAKKHNHESGSDPLLKYPLRGLAYTNEVGEALRPVIGNAGATKTYVPALLYIGADTWDKYKRGEDGDYSKPSVKTALRQGFFQATASVVLPTIAIHKMQHLVMDKVGNKGVNKAFDSLVKNKEKIQQNINKLPVLKGAANKMLKVFTNPEPVKTSIKEIASNPSKQKEVAHVVSNKIDTLGKSAMANTAKAAVGFATLAVAAPLIDKFIEEVVIKKVINPVLGLKDHEGPSHAKKLKNDAAQKLSKESAQSLRTNG